MSIENVLESCKAILESMVGEPNKETRRLKYYDFIHKFSRVELAKENTATKHKFDVIIFTVVPVEFATLSKILKVAEEGKKEDFSHKGIWYYKFDIERNHNLTPLKALVTLVGVAGDVNCSITCSRTFQKFDCDIAILCGIAAGVKKEAPMYSTVISESIVNYEFQRIEKNGTTYRPKDYPIDGDNHNVIPKMLINQETWKDDLIKTCDILSGKDSKYPRRLLDQSSIKFGVIASGAKLIADGTTLVQLRESIPTNKGIIAAEMEGSGFSPTCSSYNRKWLVFRGISDYGSDDKNNKNNKKYQYLAAASAVVTMMHYLKSFYRTPQESGDEDLPF